MGLGEGVGTGVGENNLVSDLERMLEPVSAEEVTGKAGSTREKVLVGPVVTVTNHIGLKAVFKDLRHVVHRRIQHCYHGLPTGEYVQHGGNDVPGGTNQGRPRLEKDFGAGPGLEQGYGLYQVLVIGSFLEKVAAAQVDPLQS